MCFTAQMWERAQAMVSESIGSHMTSTGEQGALAGHVWGLCRTTVAQVWVGEGMGW